MSPDQKTLMSCPATPSKYLAKYLLSCIWRIFHIPRQGECTLQDRGSSQVPQQFNNKLSRLRVQFTKTLTGLHHFGWRSIRIELQIFLDGIQSPTIAVMGFSSVSLVKNQRKKTQVICCISMPFAPIKCTKCAIMCCDVPKLDFALCLLSAICEAIEWQLTSIELSVLSCAVPTSWMLWLILYDSNRLNVISYLLQSPLFELWIWSHTL